MTADTTLEIQPRADTGHPPLSFAQQRLWYLDKLEPGNPAYNTPSAFQLSGPLDAEALRASLRGILSRHEVLRATFETRDEREVQVIAPVLDLTLPVVDLSDRPEGERETALEAYLAEETARSFDLERGPLVRASLVRLDDEEHVLFFMTHHSVFDGWSFRVFLRELAAGYEAATAGGGEPAPPPIQYSDYAVWQHENAGSEAMARQLAHWTEHLSGELPILQLPTDRPRPGTQTYHGAWETRTLPEQLTERLVAFHRKERVTLFMLLLAAFEILLHRYSGQEDIVIGTPVSGRTRPELEELMGFFVNTLALRADLSGDPTVRELVRKVRNVVLGGLSNQDLPFERLVDELQVDRDLSRSPVFQVMFDMMPATPCPGLGPVRMRRLNIERRTSHFDLTLVARDEGEGLELSFNYNTDLFERGTVSRMLANLETLLGEIVEDADRRISRIPLIDRAERVRMLRDWNQTKIGFREDACVHQLFEEQAHRTPEAPAVAFEDEELTYAELNSRVNRLARHLQGLGVGPDALVGVFMERSVDMLVTLLGIMKAGGAYVPLDPSYPKSRIEFMLEDSDVQVLVTQEKLRPLLPSLSASIVDVDRDAPEIAARPDADPESEVAPDNLAYVIYTSGSTGKPKGVMIEHRNVVNFFTGMDYRLGADKPGVWLAVTSISFDISVLELFWTLARGFKVVIQPDAEAADGFGEGRTRLPDKTVSYSLFYFAADEKSDTQEHLRLLMEGARYADQNGFEAVWTPERHFHSFGGVYPNPSVTGAAIAAVTQNVKIRAGSVVLPLHDPIRVAEEWSWVDNLSNGRVGAAIASGWHDRDFVFAPDRFSERRDIMFEAVETVQKLWRGESIKRIGGSGKEIEISTLPRPVQDSFPVWVTAAGTPRTFERAGEAGYNLLTHLLGQSVDQLAEKVAIYREAWSKAGHAGRGQVTLMLHCFVGDDVEAVRETVREPFTAYLRTAVDLIGRLAESRGQDIRAADFSDEDMDALLEHAFDRYFETSALFGTPASCLEMVDHLKEVGIDEIACLIDFGVSARDVIESLGRLKELMERSNASGGGAGRYSVAEQIRRHGVSHLQCTPSMAGLLVETEDDREALGDLKKLMIGGEAFPVSLATRLRSITDCDIVNMYGPTETTIWSSTHQLDGAKGPIPIGRPIANTQLYVLDAGGEPVPQGVPGELCIGGDGVVRGYLDRPELTAERFIPDPFATREGARLYRTGDLVRYRGDGTLEFLGRLDHQLKIRGHRIELGEIEAVLSEHPSVREAVVVAQDDGAGDRRLVGYVIGDGQEVAASELRRHLLERLPEYMVPTHFVELDAFPLTPNGKVDRKALPAADPAQRAVEVEYVAPTSDLEERIAAIWQDVLNVEQVGVDDNFFDVGGNSILTVRVHNRLRAAVDHPFVLTDLFRYPTIRVLAAHIGQGEAGHSMEQREVEESQDRGAARRQALGRRRRRA